METTLGLIILATGLGFTFFQNKPSVQQLFVGLGALALLHQFFYGFETDASMPMIKICLVAMLAIGLLITFIPLKVIQFAGVILSFLAFVPIGAKVNYLGFEIHWNLMIALLPLFGALVPLLSGLKANILKRWFPIEEEKMAVSISGFFAALLVFFSIFEASFFGPVLVGLGWLVSALVSRNKQQLNGAVGLLTLAFVLYVFKTVDYLEDSLLRGNLLMGIVAGFAVIKWNTSLKASAFYNFLLGAIAPIIILMLLVSFGIANANFGGLPTWIGAILGLSFGLITSSETIEKGTKTYLALPLVLIGFTPIVITFFTPLKLETETLLAPEPTTQTAEPTVKKDILEVDEVVLDETFKGDWVSVAANSKLEFELGPEGGKTQGAITEFKTTMSLDESGKPTKVSVTMNANKLTTFNPDRDESVLGDGYLNTTKFAKMTYTSTSIVQKGDLYEVNGNLEMMGVKQVVPLALKLAAKGDKNGKPYFVFVGKSNLDRTKHGMASDPKIGDMVEVTFEIALNKK